MKKLDDNLWIFSGLFIQPSLMMVSGLIEEGYHSTNPYHNSIHATDVTQAMHCFLQEEKVSSNY